MNIPPSIAVTRETHSLDPRLIVVREEPLNAETPLQEQRGLLTPAPLFYIRDNFMLPRIDAHTWRVAIDGAVERPYQLSYDEVRALPSRTLVATMECAGNGRSALHPPADGEQWQYGAVSTAEWTGVPLATVLQAAVAAPRAREIVIEGADSGTVACRATPIHFARSLPMAGALDPDMLLAYAMNGEPLSVQHGFPLRLIVPGWYGMASVKWVTRITAVAEAFDGYFQRERYILIDPGCPDGEHTPVTTMRVRSVICSPCRDAIVPRGTHRVVGLAWSGVAPVTRVEVSVDDGATWAPADLIDEPARHIWRRWAYTWHATTPGPVTLRSRAQDATGHTQPATPEWNRLGYANNAIQALPVQVVARQKEV